MQDKSTTRRFSLRKLKTFASMSNPVFRLYFIAIICQQVSMNMQNVVYPLLVYEITGRPALIGVVALSGALPHIFFSLFGGVIADRMVKKHVLVLGLGLFTMLSAGLAFALTTGLIRAETWWILIIATICQNSLMGLTMPARFSILTEIVGTEGLMNAVSLNTLGASILQLMAPAAAGFLVASRGYEFVYWTMAALYGLGVLFIVLMPRMGTASASTSTKSPLKGVVEGFKYIGYDRNILFILVFNLCSVVLAAPYMQLMPIFVKDILDVGAQGMGILLSVSAIGALVASFVLASLPGRKGGGWMLLVSTLALGLGLTVFAFSKSWYLSLGIMVLVGLAQTGRTTYSMTLAQHYTKDEYRGRVMGIYDMEMSFNGLAVYIAGMLTESIGVEWAVGSFAILLAAMSLLLLLFSRRMRELA